MRFSCSTGEVGKAGTILYAMGGTQHTVGSQNIRIYGLIQLLLGNIGIAGGGVQALRGESNVQGSTDFGLLYHNVPGYMEVPSSNERNIPSILRSHYTKIWLLKQTIRSFSQAC